MEGEKKKKKVPWLVVLLLAALLGAAGYMGYFLNNNTFVGGSFVPVDSTQLDLRDKGLTEVRSLVRCKNLESVDLRGNDIDPDSIRALQEALPGCQVRYDVAVGSQRYDVFTQELTLPDLPQDWTDLEKLVNLRSLTVERCTNPEAMTALQEAMPGCAMQWSLGVGGEWYDVNAAVLNIPGSAVSCQELLSQLKWFPSLREVDIDSAVLDPGDQRSLAEAYPDVRFRWPVAVGDQLLSCDVTELIFTPGEGVDLEALEAVIDLLPELKTVDFTDSDVSPAQRAAFMEAHPELDVSWTVSFLGNVYPWDTELLDLNNVAFSQQDFLDLQEILPGLPKLRQIELCDTGIPYERLEELDQKYPDIKVVWMVRFGANNYYALRTDATYFRLSEFGEYPPPMTDADAWILGYCKDMVAIDLGHQNFTDLGWLEGMSQLKYLIIVESPIQDLTPLSKLKELVYLEIFLTDVTDLSPLVECPNLKALNCCYIKASGTPAFNALRQMPQLEYLWYCGNHMTTAQLNTLKSLNPNLITFTRRGGESTGGRWRYMQYYYDMRHALGNAAPMASGTQGSDPDNPTTQIVIDDAGNKFYLENYDGDPKWWLQERYSWMNPYIEGVTG